MKIRLTQKAEKCIKKIPFQIRKKFIKQLNLLAKNINHPSLRVKKMKNLERFEARIDYHYLFTFIIIDDYIYILSIGSHDEGLGKK